MIPKEYTTWLEKDSFGDFSCFCSSVTLEKFESTGRGLCAMKEIEKEGLIMEIPGERILSALNMRFSPIFGNLSPNYFPEWAITGVLPSENDDPEDTYHPYVHTHLYQVLNSPFMATILLAMYERFNPFSYWKELISLMPSMEDSILFWSNEELQTLQGSSLDPSYIIKKNKKCTQVYLDCIAPIFQYHSELFPPKQEIRTIENFKWALTSLWSRGYMLDDDDEFPGFVPLADMFNHYPSETKDPVAFYHLDCDSNSFKVFSKRHYLIGEQVFSTYGQKSNDEWLVDYGFVFRNNPVHDIRVNHPILDPSDSFYKEKFKILTSRIDNTYISSNNKVGKLSYLRIFFFDEIEMKHFQQFGAESLADVDKLSPFDLGISFRNEKIVYEYIIEYMESIQRSDEEREKLQCELEALEAQPNLPLQLQKRKTCLIFISEEQRVLDELLVQYSQLLESLTEEINNKP